MLCILWPKTSVSFFLSQFLIKELAYYFTEQKQPIKSIPLIYCHHIYKSIYVCSHLLLLYSSYNDLVKDRPLHCALSTPPLLSLFQK